MSNNKARVIAFYLPQYHPIPENDLWWGKGFTEWTNVGKAKPLFPGHYQPRVPADLGYYDLRIPEIRQAQADLAREAGIEGFCYWHYWFGNGKRLLEKPFEEVLSTGKPDFPFCLAWANHSWEDKTWSKEGGNKMLIEQKYPGIEDYINHFYSILPAFKDSRYIKIDNKPIFVIYAPNDFPDVEKFIILWNELAIKEGIESIYFITIAYNSNVISNLLKQGYSAVILDYMFKRNGLNRYIYLLAHKIFFIPSIIDYKQYTKTIISYLPNKDYIFPCVIPNFDHTPRSGKNASLFYNCTPSNWEYLMKSLLVKLKNKEYNNNIIFLKSWNEWAEGNYMEPDLKYGNGYIDALKKVLKNNKILG